jgi:hypothetical protein
LGGLGTSEVCAIPPPDAIYDIESIWSIQMNMFLEFEFVVEWILSFLQHKVLSYIHFVNISLPKSIYICLWLLIGHMVPNNTFSKISVCWLQITLTIINNNILLNSHSNNVLFTQLQLNTHFLCTNHSNILHFKFESNFHSTNKISCYENSHNDYTQ